MIICKYVLLDYLMLFRILIANDVCSVTRLRGWYSQSPVNKLLSPFFFHIFPSHAFSDAMSLYHCACQWTIFTRHPQT